jgi:hypothetical protein
VLKYLLKNSDLGALSAFISPGFFSVVPITQSLAVAKTLLRNTQDESGWNAAKQELQKLLPSTIRVETDPPNELRALDALNAQRVLEVFFHQLLHSSVWLIDLRANRWEPGEAQLVWSPAKYFYQPSPAFRQAISSLYRGFYSEDASQFKASLEALGIAPAEQALRDHFGIEGQREVQFRLRDFQASFAKVFAACEADGSKIHSEFAALGVMLVSLYETLERTGLKLDVRGSFRRVAPLSSG